MLLHIFPLELGAANSFLDMGYENGEFSGVEEEKEIVNDNDDGKKCNNLIFSICVL